MNCFVQNDFSFDFSVSFIIMYQRNVLLNVKAHDFVFKCVWRVGCSAVLRYTFG